MQVKKDKNKAKDFENWKKQAKEKINDMKKDNLTENQVYDWILKINKNNLRLSLFIFYFIYRYYWIFFF